MRVFIAGSSKEISRARQFMARARLLGAEITYDWTTPCVTLGANPPNESIREQASDACYRAIREADAFVLLAPHPGNHSIGCWVELAWAAEYLDLDAVAIVGDPPTIYSTLGVRLADEDEALAWLRARVKEAA